MNLDEKDIIDHPMRSEILMNLENVKISLYKKYQDNLIDELRILIKTRYSSFLKIIYLDNSTLQKILLIDLLEHSSLWSLDFDLVYYGKSYSFNRNTYTLKDFLIDIKIFSIDEYLKLQSKDPNNKNLSFMLEYYNVNEKLYLKLMS